MPTRRSTRYVRRSEPDGQSSDNASDNSSVVETRDNDLRGQKSSLSFSRVEEKEELQNLNDRLSAYIEFIQQNLFSSGLNGEFDVVFDSVKDKLTSLSDVYTDEVDNLRKQLDQIALHLADTEIQLKSARVDGDRTRKELDAVKRSEAKLYEENVGLNATIIKLQKQLDRFKHITNDYEELTNQHAILKDQLEKETLLRTDLQNQLTTLTERLAFKDKLLNEQKELFTTESFQIHLRKIATETDKYRTNLTDKLNELRKELTKQTESAVRKLEANSEVKWKAEKERLRQAEERIKTHEAEYQRLTLILDQKADELNRCRSELEVVNSSLKHRDQTVNDLEKERREVLGRNRSELNNLVDLLDAKSRECADLAAIKIQLDAELAMYRSLLESEELRCNLTPSDKMLTGRPLIWKRTKKSFETNVDLDDVSSSTRRRTLKRTFDFSAQRAIGSSSIRIACSANGPLHFANANPTNGLLRIYNASDEAVNMGNWELRFDSESAGPSLLYSFPDTQFVDPHTEIQVYVCPSSGRQIDQIESAPAKRRHSLPSLYLITDASVWEPCSSVISLYDAHDSVRAVCEIEPVTSTTGSIQSIPTSSKHTMLLFAPGSCYAITSTATGSIEFEPVCIGPGLLHIKNTSVQDRILDYHYVKLKTIEDESTVSLEPMIQLLGHSDIVLDVVPNNLSKPTTQWNDNMIYLVGNERLSEYSEFTFTLHGIDDKLLAVSRWQRLEKDDDDVESSLPSWALDNATTVRHATRINSAIGGNHLITFD